MSFKECLSQVKEQLDRFKVLRYAKPIVPTACLIICISLASGIGFMECYSADAYMFNEYAAERLPHNYNSHKMISVNEIAALLLSHKEQTVLIPEGEMDPVTEESIGIEPDDENETIIVGQKTEENDDSEMESSDEVQVEPAEPEPTETEQISTEPETFVEFGITFTAVNDIVYTHGLINVRYGPSRDYAVVGKIPQGAAVTRIGKGPYGWDKIVYEDMVAYAWSKFLHEEP